VAGSTGRLIALQRSIGNRAVLSMLESPPAAARTAGSPPVSGGPPSTVLQRHFARGMHASSTPHAKHTKDDADKALSLTRTLKEEATRLKDGLTTPGTSEAAGTAATRLTEIGQIIRSQIIMVRQVSGVNYVGEMSTAASFAEGASGTAANTRDERAKVEMVDKVKREAPVKLRELEGYAMSAADQANVSVSRGSAEKGFKAMSWVQRPAGLALAELEKAKVAKQELVSLSVAAAKVDEAKHLAEAYLPPAGRALDLAQRMSDLAASVVTAWQQVFDRNDLAKKAGEKAELEVKDAEARLEQAKEQVAYLVLFNQELAIDVAEWGRDPEANPTALSWMLQDAAEKLQTARTEESDADLGLTKAKDNVPLVKKAENEEVRKQMTTASSASSTRAGEAAAGKAEVEGLADVRELAGGPGELETLLAFIPARAELKELLEAVGPQVTRRWLTSGTIGPGKARTLMATFGKSGLTALVVGLGDDVVVVDRLIGGLSATRLFELAADSGLGLVHLKAMNDTFVPERIDAYATELGLAPLKLLLNDVSPLTLSTIVAEPVKLKALLVGMTSGALATLITTVGAPGVQRLFAGLSGTRIGELAAGTGLEAPKLKALLLAGVTPTQIDSYATEIGLTEFKAFLGQVSAAQLVAIAITPDKLKALLAQVTGAEVKGLIAELTAEVVKGMVAELTALQLKGLLAELPAAALKRLKLTGAELKDLLSQYTAAEIKGLATDLGDPALKDLLTKFSATQLKAYRTTVGEDRLKHLITVKLLKANALHHYGATMLKTFVGADANTWAHLAGTPTLSNFSGQISGGHDEAAFKTYISQLVGPQGSQVPRATILSSDPPSARYKVTYQTRAGVTGSKTLIRDLATSQATWLPRINKAIWAAIKAVTFGTGQFSCSTGTHSFQGFYNGGDAVDTIYPV
jgi:hypothetical protein